jgi:hypothetical protein
MRRYKYGINPTLTALPMENTLSDPRARGIEEMHLSLQPGSWHNRMSTTRKAKSEV